MIFLHQKFLDGLDGPRGLQTGLQKAIELEHATLPTYLYSYYSLGSSNPEVASLMLSVILEEMLHFALACNILNAIGGKPLIDDPRFIPKFPGPMPGDVEAGLTVRLRKMSRQHVLDTFMVIEQPEHPVDAPPAMGVSIGDFYARILQELNDNPGLFDKARVNCQVKYTFPKSKLFAVTDAASAEKAINLIVEQGEGTKSKVAEEGEGATSPIDPEGDPAHFYRFAEIYHGRKLDSQLRYSGDPIPFDESKVLPVIDDPLATKYAPGTRAHYLNTNFNYTYTSMLKAFHLAFNGQPERLGSAMALMYTMRELAMEMMATPLPGGGVNAGPSFEYQPVNA